ncbi:hypothetical protein PG985_013896 [Apiospora marii]|uniref:Uncharacterized protein n=1 Tax=Apiospora marii TaxID=335849 RepID=A0ABR1R6H0_9PEZI
MTAKLHSYSEPTPYDLLPKLVTQVLHIPVGSGAHAAAVGGGFSLLQTEEPETSLARRELESLVTSTTSLTWTVFFCAHAGHPFFSLHPPPYNRFASFT